MMKHYMFFATFKIVETNNVRYAEIPIRIDLHQTEMPDEIGDYYFAFYKALNEAQKMSSVFHILLGIKYAD